MVAIKVEATDEARTVEISALQGKLKEAEDKMVTLESSVTSKTQAATEMEQVF